MSEFLNTGRISLTDNKPIQLFSQNDNFQGGGSRFDSGNYTQQKYNEIYHTVDLYLDNSGDFDNPRRYFINPASVIGLHISDTITDWVADGSLTFFYLPEGEDSSANQHKKYGQSTKTKTGSEKAAEENGQLLKTYQFRGDGFDLLRVMIIPKSSQGKDRLGVDITKNDTKWMLSYLFSIYDVEDVSNIQELQGHASTYMKCLKLKFHDIRYQILKTTNLEYSTAMPKDTTLTPNFNSSLANQGVLYTGDALRDVLNEALSKPEYGGCDEFVTMSGIDWDSGANEIFYTSPAQYSALDDINYLYSHHVSSETIARDTNDLSILHTNRSNTFGCLEPLVLTSISSMFKKAGSTKNGPGELQKEHFFVTAHTAAKPASSGFRAPVGGNNKDVDFKSFKYGEIISYSFLDMSPTINSEIFCSTPVYSVDVGKRQFNIQFKQNNITAAKNIIAESYISHLYKEGTDPKQLFLPTIHQSKKDRNIFPTFSLNGDNEITRQKNGIHNLIYTGLFQNACICFKTYGLTLRESGTFIGIDKSNGCDDNDYNNKLYGQWFVVQVDHLFEAGSYVNIIYAVKLHRHNALKAEFRNTLQE